MPFVRPSLRDSIQFDNQPPLLKRRAIFKLSLRDKVSRLCAFALKFFCYWHDRRHLDLDYADMSALWNDATCRVEESGVKPPQSKVYQRH